MELIVYKEPDHDRWIYGDRYPRRLVRRLLRGRQMSGYQRLLTSLRRGFEKIGVPLQVNDFGTIDRNPGQTVGVLGKRYVLDTWRRDNPLVCGPAMLDHPKDQLELFERFNTKVYLVAGPWMKAMFEPYFGDRVKMWPIGIDTDLWTDFSLEPKSTDFLVYVKFLWNQEENRQRILQPVLDHLARRNASCELIEAGAYSERDYLAKLRRARCMIFLCEHETQGQAYQEALSCNLPVLAWDQGWWLDPKAPLLEKDSVPASSVPYFSVACGETFRSVAQFPELLDQFLARSYRPREFILANLSLEASARAYLGYLRAA